MVKGGGHGCYRNIVLAPSSVQEMFDLTVLAFDLADRYRNPVVIMTDGYVGQMMEPLDIKLREIEQPEKDWAVKGTAETKKNLITSIQLEPDALEALSAQAGSQVRAGTGTGNPLRELPHRRCRRAAGRSRHRLPDFALDCRPTARARLEGRPLPSNHVVAVPMRASFARRRSR